MYVIIEILVCTYICMEQMQIKLHTIFVFNTRVELISKGPKFTELFQYIINFIVFCMFLNLPSITDLSSRIISFCIFKKYSNTVCFFGKIILH